MANPDLDELLDTLFVAAQSLLGKYGEFYPLGAVFEQEGASPNLVEHLSGEEFPPSKDVLEELRRAFHARAAAGELRASGICYDVRAQEPNTNKTTDAICAELEHEDGEAVRVFLPYAKADDEGAITYGELFAEPYKREVFATP